MKRVVLGLALAGLLALVVPASAPAASYSLFVGCDDTSEDPQPTHNCLTTDHMAAYFEASEKTDYEACIFHLTEEDCSPPTEAEADTLYFNSFTVGDAGNYELAWFIAGTEEELGAWELTVENPPPPPPPPPPPIVPPALVPVLPPAVDLGCLAARKRVTKLRARVRGAHGVQKTKLRAKLGKARTAANAAC